MLASSQVFRNSVIAQWRALDLDVLLTPMLGPALDLNAPGKATGEVSCPSTYLGHSHPPSLFCEFSPMPNRLLGSTSGALGRVAPLQEVPALEELTVRLAGEMGVIWELCMLKLEILRSRACGLGRCSLKSRWDLEKPGKIGTRVQVGKLPGQRHRTGLSRLSSLP